MECDNTVTEKIESIRKDEEEILQRCESDEVLSALIGRFVDGMIKRNATIGVKLAVLRVVESVFLCIRIIFRRIDLIPEYLVKQGLVPEKMNNQDQGFSLSLFALLNQLALLYRTLQAFEKEDYQLVSTKLLLALSEQLLVVTLPQKITNGVIDLARPSTSNSTISESAVLMNQSSRLDGAEGHRAIGLFSSNQSPALIEYSRLFRFIIESFYTFDHPRQEAEKPLFDSQVFELNKGILESKFRLLLPTIPLPPFFLRIFVLKIFRHFQTAL